MEKTNIFKCKPPEVHFTIRDRVPYNKLLTNLACSSRTVEYWPSVVLVRTERSEVRTATTSGQYSLVQPSRLVSKRLLLYGKPSLRQIPVLWLVLSRSGFCSTDRFHGNGPIRVFLFWSEAGKFKICNQNMEKKVWIMSFFTLKLSEEAKKIEIFSKFQR